MNFHYQDLKKEDREKYLLHGRCWLNNGQIVHAEWCVPSYNWSIGLSLNHYGDTAVGFGLALGLFSIHLSTENHTLFRLLEPITKRKDQKYTNGRTVGVSWHNKALWFDLWNDPMESRSVDPKWWHFSVHFDDLLLGKAKHSLEVLKEGDTTIDMPEGDYQTHYKIQRRTWKRPLWFAKVREEIDFDIPVGIPHEGKGENSWDMGMDATFGTGANWNGSLREATNKIALGALKERQRHGNLSSPGYEKWRTERLEKLKKLLKI